MKKLMLLCQIDIALQYPAKKKSWKFGNDMRYNIKIVLQRFVLVGHESNLKVFCKLDITVTGRLKTTF